MMPEYIVKNSDGMYLMKWRSLGICILEDNTTAPVYSLVFGSKRSQAHVFSSLSKPQMITRGHRGIETEQIR